MFPVHKVEQNPQTWWKVIAGRSDNNNWSEEEVSDTLQDVGTSSDGNGGQQFGDIVVD